jgi:hypothetical protein
MEDCLGDPADDHEDERRERRCRPMAGRGTSDETTNRVSNQVRMPCRNRRGDRRVP